MKVKDIKTGKVLDANDCYGARLIEQGKAILCEEAEPVQEVSKEKAAKKAANA